MTDKQILKKCFHSTSNIWESFLEEEGALNILFYPSAGEDLRPFVFSKKENLEYIGLNDSHDSYIEPNLLIFSDYFSFENSRFFDSRVLHVDNYTSVCIESYCELIPADPYKYTFNEKYVHFKPSHATGKAIFFKAIIDSNRAGGSFCKYAIYFFYENVGLIEQLFLKNKLSFSHFVWKRDGSGLGGGNVKLDFIFNIACESKIKFFFIWDKYLNEETALITEKKYNKEFFPEEIRPWLTDDFQLLLHKKLLIRWEKYDRVNLYFSE